MSLIVHADALCHFAADPYSIMVTTDCGWCPGSGIGSVVRRLHRRMPEPKRHQQI